VSTLEAPLAGAMAVVSTPATVIDDDLATLADGLALSSARFVSTMEAVAQGVGEDQIVALLLLEVSDILSMGARLGAISDVVPEGRFEPDAGREPDVDALRANLARRLAPVDVYMEVFDPYADVELVSGRLSDDLCQIALDLLHGLAHHAAGRTLESLWWWQTTYLCSWGDAAASCLRALHSIISHVRSGAILDSPMPADEA
jgi:hypothetical protein